jgi:trimeric autotransporter adhesin
VNRYQKSQRGFVLGIIFLSLLGSIISSQGQYADIGMTSSPLQGGILYVGGIGPGNYSKIQEAINDSIPGGMIYVYNDSSPYEEHLVIQKSISLIGEDSRSTEINGSSLDNSLDTIQVIADDVVIRNFHLCDNKGYYYQASVKVSGDFLSLSNCIVSGNEWIGVSLVSASFCMITDCEFYDNLMAVNLVGSDDNIIQNCSFSRNAEAIVLTQSSDQNQIRHCSCNRSSFSGIHIQQSIGNSVSDCLCQNGYGITLSYAPQTTMRNNTLENNIVNFGIGSPSVMDFYCDIDTSNTINGKPIYLLIGAHDLLFDESIELGFLGLVSCQNIVVKNLRFTNNFEGLLLAGTMYSSVENCSFTNNEGHGMYVISSMENIVENCTFRNGYFDGIFLLDSHNNTVRNCSSYKSYAGVKLEESTHNTILRQTVDQCTIGILFDGAGNNTVKESELFHCGLHVIGDAPADHINDVDTTNSVNGKPLYYFVDHHNEIIPADAGQVILVSSDGCMISGQNLSDASVGIELAYSSLNMIENNILTMNSAAAIDFDGMNNNLNIIKNNIIQGNNYGVDVDASIGNQFQDNVFSENGLALSLSDAESSQLIGNTIRNGSAGISFDHSLNNELTENIIQNMSSYGLSFRSSPGNRLEKNQLEHCGFIVYGDSPGEYFNEVDTSNTVNGKPVYYLINAIGFTVPQDAGTVILVNSSDCLIQNLDLRSGTIGITLAYSSQILIQGNHIEDQSWTGIDLSSGSNDNNTIQRNTIQRNSYGIDIEYCKGNTLKNNIISSNSYGILLFYNIDTIIRRNTIVQNSIGIDAVQTADSIVNWNNIFLNTLYGLSVEDCTVSAEQNWWGSLNGPVIEEDGNGDHLNTIRGGHILYVPWHRFPILFSGLLRFILSIIQQKNTVEQSGTKPMVLSFEQSSFSLHGFDAYRMRSNSSHQEQIKRPLAEVSEDFDSPFGQHFLS